MLTEYRRDGVVAIRNFFTPEEANDIRAHSLMSLTQAGEDKPYRSGGRLQVRGNYPALMFWPSLVSGCLDEVRLSLVALVRGFLGNDVKQLNNQLYFRLPGDGDAFAWHQDVMFRKKFSGGAYDYIQTAIAVDPMTEENGGIGFVLGSHECKDLNLVEKKDLRNPTGPPTIFGEDPDNPMPVKFFDLNPGDVLVWSHMTVHGSGPNKSDRSRMTYMNGFAKAHMCEGWPYYLRAGQQVERVDTNEIPYK